MVGTSQVTGHEVSIQSAHVCVYSVFTCVRTHNCWCIQHTTWSNSGGGIVPVVVVVSVH